MENHCFGGVLKLVLEQKWLKNLVQQIDVSLLEQSLLDLVSIYQHPVHRSRVRLDVYQPACQHLSFEFRQQTLYLLHESLAHIVLFFTEGGQGRRCPLPDHNLVPQLYKELNNQRTL